MINFEQTYRVRRAVYGTLQQSQKSESHAAELSAKLAVNCKRDLLVLLSAWLLKLDSANALPTAERGEIQSLTQMSLGEWVQLQATAVQRQQDLREAKGKLAEAEDAFKKEAPVGWITKMVVDAKAKSKINALQDNVAAARKHCESLSAATKKNESERQRLGEMFFRDCLRQWDKLASTRALGKEAGAILDHMTKETNAIWVNHRKQQMEDLDRVAKLVEGLRESYNDTPATSPQRHQAAIPKGRGNMHLGQGNTYDFTEE